MSAATQTLDRPASDAAPQRIDPHQIEPHRRQLTAFAMRLLRDRAAAEDAVQETMLAALASPDGFAGRSSLKTWLFGVLKHKITDTFRRQSREQPLEHDAEPEDFDRLFSEDGHWREPPCHWGDPEAALMQHDFLELLQRCIDTLPKNTARVFMMREVMGMELSEICAAVGITPNNCAVMLHRARMTLRARLEQRWFRGESMPLTPRREAIGAAAGALQHAAWVA